LKRPAKAGFFVLNAKVKKVSKVSGSGFLKHILRSSGYMISSALLGFFLASDKRHFCRNEPK